MSPISLPAVPVDATGVRPEWAELPADLRAAIERRLGAPVTAARSGTAGFTRGFASVLTTADGHRTFVKAARLADQAHVADWYAREAAVAAALPAGVPAARPRWTLATAGHFVVGLDAIDGRVPVLPWRPAELSRVLEAWAATAALLAPPPAELVGLGLPALADLARRDLSWWREVADRRGPLPPGPRWVAARVADLAALESTFREYAGRDRRLLHYDLRPDNLLIERAGAAGPGRVWICDWNWVCVGPPWFDTASLLVSAYASDLDADALFAAHPTAQGAPAGGLDAALAALAGHLLGQAGGAPTLASPHLKSHQRWMGEAALSWLAERQGWR